MQIDPRLNAIDDSLYRVAVRALIVQDNKILLVKEFDGGNWWAIPGGGIAYGENLKSALTREVNEELGVATTSVSSTFQIAHYTIGKVVNGIPRMNVFFKCSVPEDQIVSTQHVDKWGWFNKEEFFSLDMNPSYDKTELAQIIFD